MTTLREEKRAALLDIFSQQQSVMDRIHAHRASRGLWPDWHYDWWRIGLEAEWIGLKNRLYALAGLPHRWRVETYPEREAGGLLPSQWAVEGAALRRAALAHDVTHEQAYSFTWLWPVPFEPPEDERLDFLARYLDPRNDDPADVVILAVMTTAPASGPLPNPDPDLIALAAELGLPYAAALGTRTCGATDQLIDLSTR